MEDNEKKELFSLIQKNIVLFVCAPLLDMKKIDIKIVCHRLSLNTMIKLLIYRKGKKGGERRMINNKEVRKLREIRFIIEIKRMFDFALNVIDFEWINLIKLILIKPELNIKWLMFG